jgi:hypothetical protein
MYNPQGQQNTEFYEVLLADGASNIIYTSLLQQNMIGFNSNAYDFQMIVGEDGHDGDTSTSTYYFYAEIN